VLVVVSVVFALMLVGVRCVSVAALAQDGVWISGASHL